MRKKFGLGVLLLLCLFGILASLPSRPTGDALRITYLGTTTNSMDRFGVTNQSHRAVSQFGGPQIARHNEGNAYFVGSTRHLARGEGFILEVPVLVPSGKEWRLELTWEYDWRHSVRNWVARQRPIRNGSIVDRMEDYFLPKSDDAHGEWIRQRFLKAD